VSIIICGLALALLRASITNAGAIGFIGNLAGAAASIFRNARSGRMRLNPGSWSPYRFFVDTVKLIDADSKRHVEQISYGSSQRHARRAQASVAVGDACGLKEMM
jgi:hypothetical protein